MVPALDDFFEQRPLESQRDLRVLKFRGSAFDENEPAAAGAAVERLVGSGPTVAAAGAGGRLWLAPYPALLGAALTLLLLAPRLRRPAFAT